MTIDDAGEGDSVGDAIEVQEPPARRQRIEGPEVSSSSPSIRASVRGGKGVRSRRAMRGRRQ